MNTVARISLRCSNHISEKLVALVAETSGLETGQTPLSSAFARRPVESSLLSSADSAVWVHRCLAWLRGMTEETAGQGSGACSEQDRQPATEKTYAVSTSLSSPAMPSRGAKLK